MAASSLPPWIADAVSASSAWGVFPPTALCTLSAGDAPSSAATSGAGVRHVPLQRADHPHAVDRREQAVGVAARVLQGSSDRAHHEAERLGPVAGTPWLSGAVGDLAHADKDRGPGIDRHGARAYTAGPGTGRAGRYTRPWF